VLLGPLSASDPRLATYRWRWHHLTSPQCPQPRHLYRHADPRRQDCIELFLCSASDTQYSLDNQQTCFLSIVIVMVLARLDYGSATLATATWQVSTYRCQHGLAPSYLSADLHRIADADSLCRLRSRSTAVLLVPRTRHTHAVFFLDCLHAYACIILHASYLCLFFF